MTTPTLPVPNPVVLVLSVLHTLLALAGWVAVLAVAIVRWKETRLCLRQGMILAGVGLALSLPASVASALFLDMSKVLPPQFASVSGYVGALAAVFGLVLTFVMAAHLVLKVAVAEMAAAEHPPFPLAAGRADRFGGWVLAAALGLGGGAVSALVFHLLQIRPGDAFQMMQRMFPALNGPHGSYLMLAFAPSLLAAAISEEILYRGVLQAWLVRGLGGGRVPVLAAIAITSAVWAIAHAPNATPIVPKLVQIFLLGLALGWLARRHSVEASMIAHMSFNVAVTVLALVLRAP